MQSKNGKYVPEYYSFDVKQLEVSDTFPRKITALTITGKSMQGGYHEDTIFEWAEKIVQPTKATPKQIEILLKAYTGDLLTKLLEKNNISKIEDLPASKASEIITKLGARK